MSSAQDDGAARLMHLVVAGSLSMAVCVAAYLRLPDLLQGGARDVRDIARDSRCDSGSLRRLLRALCSLGFCEDEGDGRFALTASGRLLCSGAEHSLRSWAIWWGRYMWPVWGELLHSVTTGESARRHLTGADDFRHLADDDEAADFFNGAMAEFTAFVAREVVQRYDFGDCRRVVDVGGGYGALLAAVLGVRPAARGVLLELPHAIAGARRFLERARAAERCELVAGDFFRAVPEGGDLYLLKAVLHDWDDESCLAILRNCRRAMAPEGRLIVIERVMPATVRPSPTHEALARADLNMLLAQGGREREEAEFRALLEGARFRASRIFETGLEYSVVEAIPV